MPKLTHHGNQHVPVREQHGPQGPRSHLRYPYGVRAHAAVLAALAIAFAAAEYFLR